MKQLSLKDWLGVVGVAILVAVVTWTGLNLGRTLYADWAFLHAVRLANEAAAAQPKK